MRDGLDRACARLTREAITESLAEIATAFDALFADRDEWQQQHENLLAVRQQDIAALAATPASVTPDAGELANRVHAHSVGLKEHAKYDPAAPSGLTNADAVSYGDFIAELGTALGFKPFTAASHAEKGEVL